MSLVKNVGTIGGLTAVSRVFGFVRDMLLSRALGAGLAADAWQLAFTLPNTFRRLFAEGAFSVAFVPMYTRKLGATVASFDDADAMNVTGVRAVRQIPQGVAVYADSTFAAISGRNALKIEWDESGAETRSSDQIYADFAKAAEDGGQDAEMLGNGAADIEGAAQVIEAEFRFPYLAHAPMEPLDGVIEVREDGAEAWMGSQFPALDKPAIAKALGLEHDPATGVPQTDKIASWSPVLLAITVTLLVGLMILSRDQVLL